MIPPRPIPNAKLPQDKREAAIQRLQDHYAREHIDVEEFESLVEHAEYARDESELKKLFDGLPELENKAIVPVKTAALSPIESSIAQLVVQKPRGIVTVFASTSRKGHWQVPSYLPIRAVFGSVELDLSQVDLPSGETHIDIKAVFGSVSVIVPEGLAVICEGNAVLGSFDHVLLDAESRRDKRSLRITGNAVFGAVDIIQRKRQKSGGDLQQIGQQIGDGIRALLGRR